MTDTRSSSAMFKRAEQLKRWEESDTNKQSSSPKSPARIQFSTGIVFLAACAAGDKDEVQRLLKLGADINTSNVDGLTALHQACIDDNLDMVEFLVTHGADVNRGDNEGWTPLHATASCGFLSIARYLLESGADVAAVNCDGELAVDIAESDAMEQLLQKMIDERGIDCEKSRNAEVDTLLADAKKWASNGYTDVRDPKTGGTPLHVAAAKGYINVLKTLLEDCNLEVDCTDYEGWTPLHAAALWGQKKAASILIKFGADPLLKNYSGQTCLDLVDPVISSWLTEAVRHVSNNNNNNNKKRKIHSPPRTDVKRVELQITGQTENAVNDAPPATPDIAPVPHSTQTDDPPPWRSASFTNRQTALSEYKGQKKPTNSTQENDTILRRTHSFENDKTFIQRYRDVTARIKATSCPSIPPPATPPPKTAPPAISPPATPPPATSPTSTPKTVAPTTTASAIQLRNKEDTNQQTDTNEETQNNARVSPDRKEREANTWSPVTTSQTASPTNSVNLTPVRSSEESNSSSTSTPSSATPTKLSPGNIFKNFFKSFVPPVRDEESETQRKAHAKRVRETRRSTQGVTLDELKSAEQLVKKKTNNGTTESPTVKSDEAPSPAVTYDNSQKRVAVTAALASVAATATATIAPAGERRPSWRLRLDPANKFELEDAGRSSPRPNATTAATVATTVATTVAATIATTVAATEATVTVRRPPSGVTTPTVNNGTNNSSKDDPRPAEEERENSLESKSSPAASTQAASNVIQRRRRPKRRSTGVTHLHDNVNDGEGGEGDVEPDNTQSGNERTEEAARESERDYKALYEASQTEVRRLRALLATSEQQLREARATITRVTKVNQNSLSEVEKREKRAMERKLSEMEEELKQLQKLKAENERLRAENRALTRVVSKLTNSANK